MLTRDPMQLGAQVRNQHARNYLMFPSLGVAVVGYCVHQEVRRWYGVVDCSYYKWRQCWCVCVGGSGVASMCARFAHDGKLSVTQLFVEYVMGDAHV